jgi:D-apiose dehydrogenase
MRSRPLRVGVIGAGYFAQFHLQAWQRMANAALVAVCDQTPAKLDKVAMTYAHAERFADVDRMLSDAALDLVDIVTPPKTHAQLVTKVSAAGLAAVCQKPLAPSYDEAVAIVETAEAANTLLVVHENIRFAPWHREMARLVAAGRLGPLHNVAMRLRPGDGQGPRAYLDRQPYFQQMPRFLIHETAIHWIDTFRYLAGEITGVFARLRKLNPAIAGEDAGIVMFAFEHDAHGVFDGNRLNDHETDNTRRTMGEMWLEGANGVLRLDGRARLWWKAHGEAEVQHHYQWHDRAFAGDAVYALQHHVVTHLRAGTPIENSARAYLRNLDIQEAVYQSHQQGRWIPTPCTPAR